MSEFSEPVTNEPIADDPIETEVIDHEVLYAGRIQTFVRERFRYNDSEITREFFQHPGAVGVVAMDDQDRVLTIKQYRHPIRTRDWEIPAGLLDVPGEPYLDAAKRELAEEVDLEAAEWEILADSVTSPGGSNESLRIYLARGLTATHAAFAREEEEADIVIRWIPIDELVDAIAAGTVKNSLLQIGVLAAFAARARGLGTLRREQ